MNKQNFYLTTPLYYVNAEPHIGSAYTTMAADTICRFEKLKGKNAYLLTGVDEHGGKIENTAKSRNISPKAHCDEITLKFEELWKLLNIDYQRFSRTSSENHNKIVQIFFELVKAKGDIYQAEYKGLYCLACEDFKNERELLEGKLCPTHKTQVQEYTENNYFFALSKYNEQIRQFLNDNPDFIYPQFRKHEVLAWLDEGLRDFPISRNSVKWGIPIPDDKEQTIYVWFDALLGYLSPLIEDKINLQDLNIDNFAQIVKSLDLWPVSLHLIGKDILRFHAVYWIAMLMSAELPLPKRLFGHGFLTKDGEKMGKTLGNIIVPQEIINKYGIDAIRFYFLFNIPFGQDGDFSEQIFIETVNAYLANRLGNLFSRVLKLLENNLNSQIPAGLNLDFNSEIAQSGISLANKVDSLMHNFELDLALKEIFNYIDKLNLYLTETKPWTLFKEESETARQKAIICLVEVLEGLRIVANVLFPFMPDLGLKMLNIFNLTKTQNWEELSKWAYLKPESEIKNTQGALFQRIENIQKIN